MTKAHGNEGVAFRTPIMNLPTVGSPRAGADEFEGQQWRVPLALRNAHLPTAIAGALAILAFRCGHTCSVTVLVDGTRWIVENPSSGGESLGDWLIEPPQTTALKDPMLPSITVLTSIDEQPPSDLILRLAEDGDCFVAHNPHVYDADTVTGICACIEVLLEAAVRAPATPISRAPLLNASQRELLLTSWNGPDVPHPDGHLLHEMVAAQVARTPGATALVQGTEAMTYRDLDCLANGIAHRLRDLGVREEDVVGVCEPPSIGLYAVILGIFKAGAAFAYLDPKDPPRRRAELVELCSMQVVIGPVDVSASSFLPNYSAGIEELLPQVPHRNEPPESNVSTENTAYVLFTSGSTGAPKAVMNSHRMAAWGVLAEQEFYEFDETDIHLLKSPISCREFIWPLATGGCCAIAAAGRDRDEKYLIELMASTGVTTASFVPSMWNALLRRDLVSCQSLQRAFTGGESLPQEVEMQLRSIGLNVYNTYVLTEAEFVSVRRGPSTRETQGTVVGRPNMRVYICDQGGELLPPGVVGELCTGGPGVATGYIGRPDLTAETFVPDPYSQVPGAVMVRTRDMARFLEDGQIEFIGRADNRVKVRGLQVDPSEVEIALARHPRVAAAAVVGVSDTEQGSSLVAYVIWAGPDPSVEDIRGFLVALLPSHMIPRSFVFLDTFPLLPSGKLDRSSLPAASRDRPLLQTPYEPPRDDLERTLVSLFEQVVDVRGVGIHDDFTMLGGDSLRFLRLRQILEQELGGPIDLDILLETRSVSELAARLRAPARADSESVTSLSLDLLLKRGKRIPQERDDDDGS